MASAWAPRGGAKQHGQPVAVLRRPVKGWVALHHPLGDGVECSLACHEGHDGGLDASAQADDRQGMGGLHQASTSLPSSDEESASGAGSLSSDAYLTSRVKGRRSRSWASGPGLNSMVTTPSSEAPADVFSVCFSWLLPYRCSASTALPDAGEATCPSFGSGCSTAASNTVPLPVWGASDLGVIPYKGVHS